MLTSSSFFESCSIVWRRKLLRNELLLTAFSCVSLGHLQRQALSHACLSMPVILLRLFLNRRHLLNTGGSKAGKMFAVPTMRFEVLEYARYNRTTRCIYITLSSEDGIGSLCWAARGFERVAMSFESRCRAFMSCRRVLCGVI